MFDPVKNLICNNENKKKHSLFCMHLIFHNSEGMKVAKVHRLKDFKQKPWLKPFETRGTKKRATKVSFLLREIYNLLVSAFYGEKVKMVVIDYIYHLRSLMVLRKSIFNKLK